MGKRLPIENLSSVSETMLTMLYARARESRRSDGVIQDPQAEAWVERIDYDFARGALGSVEQAGVCIRLRQFDRFTRSFLAAHPAGVVVHLGCGLNTRFERVDNGRVLWYELDLPPVIAVRRQLQEETERHRFIAASALSRTWLDVVNGHAGKPTLFVAEGLSMYLEENEMRGLVMALREGFPGAELVFDAASPLIVSLENLKLRWMRAGYRMRWGMRGAGELEGWAPGVRLLDEWNYTRARQTRIAHLLRIARLVPSLGEGLRIVRYRLGGERGAGTLTWACSLVS